MRSRWAALFIWTAMAVGIAAAGYYWYSVRASAPVAQAKPAPPAPEVAVLTATPRPVSLPLTYAGRVAGFREVEVRAQVGGVLRKRSYEEGARVSPGQVLFRIDPEPYQVALDRAKAQLAQAQASFVQSDQNFRRVEELSRRQVATDKQLDDARAARSQSEATVKLAEAEVRSATLNLGYTTVSAPVGGTTSLRSPPEGTLILAQQTLLTTITILDPAYVNFAVTDDEFRSLREMNQKREKPLSADDIMVELRYGDGSLYPTVGKLDVTASTIDAQTGTIHFRALFPNPDGVILPGQFVRVSLRGVTIENAIVIPQKAVLQGPQGPFVYVSEEEKAERRPVRLGRQLDEGWIVEDGLKGGEQVIIEGVMRVRPGAAIRLAQEGGRDHAPGPRSDQRRKSGQP
ncbi:efflux RND transporter periplasmic adaptor subunit [Pseudorhodoplanes sp.]|uniref:efflux RND transporter periplasmic adaptor subunit n=1 Tax=Pseudorhodoplanes sp. TaxID=1934341 RepID=UPI003D139776